MDSGKLSYGLAPHFKSSKTSTLPEDLNLLLYETAKKLKTESNFSYPQKVSIPPLRIPELKYQSAQASTEIFNNISFS